MNKLNPWRNGDFAECVARLEKAGIKPPKAFDLMQDILDRIEKIEREDERVLAAHKAARDFREQHGSGE
jgi:hypothetical protein